MVSDWIKFLRKLDNKKQDIIFESIQKILSGEVVGLDIKPILGKKGYFRCREGNIRIIFLIENKKIFIKKVGNRGDIYKGI